MALEDDARRALAHSDALAGSGGDGEVSTAKQAEVQRALSTAPPALRGGAAVVRMDESGRLMCLVSPAGSAVAFGSVLPQIVPPFSLYSER